MTTWQAMTDLSVNDIVPEMEFDALQNNLTFLKEWRDKKTVIYDLMAGAQNNYTTSTTYTKVNGNELSLIPAEIAENANVYFEVIMRASSGSYTASARLAVNGTEVASSEVSTSSTSFVRLRSGDISAALTGTGAETFDARFKISNSSYRNYFSAARLIVEPTG